MRRIRHIACVAALAAMTWNAALADSFVVRAKAVYPVTVEQPGPIEHGMIVVRDGRIVAVGRDVEVPPDLPLYELRDEIICPGFVSAGSALAGMHRGAESVSGAYRAIDAFDTYAANIEHLARGTTTVHLSPGGHRLVAGRGAVVKLAGPAEQRVLSADSDLTLTLGVFDPPPVVEPPFYASSDVPIEPVERQRPDSRLGQFLELELRIAAAGATTSRFDLHVRDFNEAWNRKVPLRIQVRRAADIEAAAAFATRHERPAYLVGMNESDRLADALAASGLPVVLRLEHYYRTPDRDLGPDPDVLETRAETAARLAPPRLALAGREGDTAEDLRLVAAIAQRGGMPREQALAAITRVPAEILGVADRVGSLAPGRDADFLVMTGAPLDTSSHVRRAYVAGRKVFQAPASDDLVVKAGTIWVGDGTVITDGALLIRDGKIRSVGRRVPHPLFARVVDAGTDGFITPGFIDAHGHLGLQQDRTRVTPDIPIHATVGVPGREHHRVAEAGVTTVMLSPYRVASDGGRMAAVKTFGRGRDDMLVRDLAGMQFDVGDDPLLGVDALKNAIEAGKKYDEQWKKYYDELRKWEQQQASGKKAETKPKEEVERREEDPITGTWSFVLSGQPLPQEFHGTAQMRLDGNRIEGRGSIAEMNEEFEMQGTLDGKQVRLEVVMNIDIPLGPPVIEATLDRPDHMLGHVRMGDQGGVDFEADRTDKSAVEFTIRRRRGSRKDGKPVPPKINEKLEPYRPLLAGGIPAVVRVSTAAQAQSVMKLLVDEYALSVVLLGAEDAAEALPRDVGSKQAAQPAVAAALPTTQEAQKAPEATQPAEAKPEDKRVGRLAGVIAPPAVVRYRDRRPYNQAADLAERGVPVALQSDAEDGARALPLMGLYAVQQGFGGDAALRALTIDAARMFGLDDRLGSLEPGKDADVLIHSGHPFDAGSRLERVIIGGREVPTEFER